MHGWPHRMSMVVLLSGAVLTAALWSGAIISDALVFGQRSAAESTPAVSSVAYTIGERVHLVKGLEFASSSHTMVAFIGSSCQFCIDSAPLYRALADRRDRGRGVLQFIIAGREPVERLQEFATRYHVRPDRLVSVVAADVKVRMTPTLVLVDRSGIVQGVWTGEQPGARGEAILQRLRANGSRA